MKRTAGRPGIQRISPSPGIILFPRRSMHVARLPPIKAVEDRVGRRQRPVPTGSTGGGNGFDGV